MHESGVSTKFDLQYADKNICFSFLSCSFDKKYAFWNITKDELTPCYMDAMH
ncbi:MAG: hypothetical protein OYG31_01325 [Candidatus Kaiserbacteria bacterium]|nr:hypothetical protein [Candidatus Kaiserbacteria bacterium]